MYAGYLETMFAGVGGEVLYRPVDSRLAYGIDINYVKQRDPYNQLSTLDYDAITGHASVYWQPEMLKGTQLTVSAGQFLAKDKGVNIDFAKRFDSGIVVGAYAAFTDVSSEEYQRLLYLNSFRLVLTATFEGERNIPLGADFSRWRTNVRAASASYRFHCSTLTVLRLTTKVSTR